MSFASVALLLELVVARWRRFVGGVAREVAASCGRVRLGWRGVAQAVFGGSGGEGRLGCRCSTCSQSGSRGRLAGAALDSDRSGRVVGAGLRDLPGALVAGKRVARVAVVLGSHGASSVRTCERRRATRGWAVRVRAMHKGHGVCGC